MYGASPVRFHWNLSLANGGVLNDEGYATLAGRQAILASQVGCRFVLLRRSLEFAQPDDPLGRRAEFPGTELHARRDEKGRSGFFLPLRWGRPGNSGDHRDRAGRISRPHRARSEGSALRSKEQERGVLLVDGGRQGHRTLSAAHIAQRDADEARARGDAAPPEGEPPLGSESRRGRVECRTEAGQADVRLSRDRRTHLHPSATPGVEWYVC